MKYIAVSPSGSSSLTLEETPLGSGGEGNVYSVISHNLKELGSPQTLVAKIYHEPELENRHKKIKAMISSPVKSETIAWPTALIFDESKRFKGFLMTKLEAKVNREWLYIANAKDRRKVAPDFDVRYAFAAIRNLAAAVLSVHSSGHKIGDLNESNLLINNTATVLIVDTDSMQISSPSGEVFPCTVGKPEYTAPELSHGSLRDFPRTVESDTFAFAVASYQLITGGATPHQGAFDPHSDDDPLSTVERIRQGVLPGLIPSHAKTFGFTPKPGVPVAAIPAFMKAQLVGFLSVAPELRNSPTINLRKLIAELDAYIPTLVQCSRERHHWYPQGETCVWCSEAAVSGIDPWAGDVASAPSQARLAPISFQSGDNSAPLPSRAAPAVAGQQAHQANQGAAAAAAAATNPAAAQAIAAAAVQQYIQQQGGAPAGAPPATPAPQRPHKIKGKVTVEYANGSWGVRPPLGVLMRQSPKLAIWALKEETPAPLKFWWPADRPLANPVGLIIGLILGFALAGAWYAAATIWLPFVPFIGPAMMPGFVATFAVAPVFTAAIASLWLFISAHRDRAKTKKLSGSLTGYKEDKLSKTAFRFLPVGLFYGVPIIVVIAFGFLFGAFALIRAIGRA